MSGFKVYQDLAERTNGEFYLGVCGPVRTGKSTFIKRFMELMVIPGIEDENEKERTTDELPQSADGKTIMRTEIYSERSRFGRLIWRKSGKSPHDRLCRLYCSGSRRYS